MKNKIVLFTAASNTIIADPEVDPLEAAIPGYRFMPKLHMILNKKKSPADSREWGFVIELKVDRDHVLIPERFKDCKDSGYNLALIRVPDEH